MFLRFAAAIGLMTAIGLMAIAIEKQNLSVKRAISLQYYQMDVLREQRCRLVYQTQQLAAPHRLFQEREQTNSMLDNATRPRNERR